MTNYDKSPQGERRAKALITYMLLVPMHWMLLGGANFGVRPAGTRRIWCGGAVVVGICGRTPGTGSILAWIIMSNML